MQILVITHGDFAKGLCSTLNMFFAEANVDNLCLGTGGMEQFATELEVYLKNVNEALIVLCDLQGGTPFNQTVSMREKLNLQDKVGIVAGVNLPMLLQLYALKENIDLKGALSLCEEFGKNGVVQYIPASFSQDDNF